MQPWAVVEFKESLILQTIYVEGASGIIVEYLCYTEPLQATSKVELTVALAARRVEYWRTKHYEVA